MSWSIRPGTAHRVFATVAVAAVLSGCTPNSPTGSTTPAPMRAGNLVAEPVKEEADCVVIVDALPDYGTPPLRVRFETELECTSPSVTYSWDFGDGSRGGNEAQPTHTYSMTGDFVAIVRVVGSDGLRSDDEIDIVVSPMLDR